MAPKDFVSIVEQVNYGPVLMKLPLIQETGRHKNVMKNDGFSVGRTIHQLFNYQLLENFHEPLNTVSNSKGALCSLKKA
jgi:hypothetical protein